jgi:hypothetical protein
MFSIIIVIVFSVIAAVVISNITVEAVSSNVISSNKEIVMTSNVKSIAQYTAIYSQWVSIDTSVEEYSANAVNVVVTNNGVWKMTRVVNKSVKFSGRSFYTGNNVSGWLFVNTTTGNSDMLLDIAGNASGEWEARNWFGNGNFAMTTKVVVK